jgi:hypothetical protein
MNAPDRAASHGRLLPNLLHFGRLLRLMGVRVSTRQVYELAAALNAIDISREEDFYHTACCFLAHGPEELALFDRAFDIFWKGRIELMIELGLAKQARARQEALDDLPPAGETILQGGPRSTDPPPRDGEEPETIEEEARQALYSPDEALYLKDFARFTEEELEAARRFIHSLVWRLDERLTRRLVRASKQAHAIDLRRAIRRSLAQGGEIVTLPWQRRKPKPRPLVVICDISGSMERYSRMFLHFMYALVQDVGRVEAFVFGTRLTRITPALRTRDVDAALDRMAERVFDWSGGTRIGESLRTFNREWARRVLGWGAAAIIISDGWDRGDIDLLESEIARLHRSVSRLIWLNPLLGLPGYEPLVRGIQAALPHIDDFLPLHNLESMEQFALALGRLGTGRRY